jgi:monoamine oxidase
MALAVGDVQLGQVVDGVRIEADGVTARLGAARSVEARAAVVAVPAPIAASMPVDPGLPADLTTALRELPMGTAAKLAVPTRGTPSKRVRQSAEASYWTWVADGEQGEPRRCVASFAGSSSTLDALGITKGRSDAWVDAVAAMNPDLEFDDGAVMYAWGDDPFSQGCYAAWDAPSLTRADLFTQPVDRIAFAGEHTAGPEFHGTMEGALRSGRRAADQVMEMLT